MTLFIEAHKNIIIQILLDIYSDNTIAPYLGFKGGTAAYLFYGLDRFSVDLDFDLLEETKKDYVFERVKKIMEKYGTIKEAEKKRFNLFFLLSYDKKAKNAQNIKVEINRRFFGSKYIVKAYMGISMLVMTKKDMFANKLVAMHERLGNTNRDIFDVWFFSKSNWDINRGIIEERTKLSYKAFLLKCVSELEKMIDSNILDGMGELLTEKQKSWTKSRLKFETILQLKLRLESEIMNSNFSIIDSKNLTYTKVPGHSFSRSDILATSYSDVKNGKVLEIERQNSKSLLVKVLSDTTGHEVQLFIRSTGDEGIKEISAILDSGLDFSGLTYDSFLNYEFKK